MSTRSLFVALLFPALALMAGCRDAPVDDGSATVIQPGQTVRKPAGAVNADVPVFDGRWGMASMDVTPVALREDLMRDYVTIREAAGRPFELSADFCATVPGTEFRKTPLRSIRLSVVSLHIDADGHGAKELRDHPDDASGLAACFQYQGNKRYHVDTGQDPLGRDASFGTVMVDSVRKEDGRWAVYTTLTAMFSNPYSNNPSVIPVAGVKIVFRG